MERKSVQQKIEIRREGLRGILLLPTSGSPHGLLTMLHGAGESPETLLENFDMESAVENHNMALLLPDLGNSFCLDQRGGLGVRSALLSRLLPGVQAEYRLSGARQANVVGGISMGGFAALSLALCESEHFCAAFSLSGALDLKKAAQLLRICSLTVPDGLGEASWLRECALTRRLDDCPNKPSLYLVWGDEDWFRESNRVFSEKAAANGFAIRATESPGLHDWVFWKNELGPAIRWAAETI